MDSYEPEEGFVKRMGDFHAAPKEFDRTMGALHGLPDVVHTKPLTMQIVGPLGVGTQTWIVQTYRQKDIGDTIFLQSITDNTTRLVIPARVADAIARQRDQLTGKVRSKVSKAAAQARKDAGILPG